MENLARKIALSITSPAERGQVFSRTAPRRKVGANETFGSGGKA